MPESRKRKIDGKQVKHVHEKDTEIAPHWTDGIKPTPSWWAPVFVALGLIGLVWLMVYYLSGARYPVPGIGNWNMAIALGFMMAGFMMVLRWR
ncbi:septation inhibitor protein [Boudabousia liubingyangii]|uniref:Cell division protein CrgA n=1 Tax=Boudabousia liubingyangii TaxID=1921764 RepID=A0A1Q5PPQ4_9ACTO|nr:cell division protein CrgA [Boudabousia liubingyangii]OKL48534.1 septation inhibitor protein [Boudabousia liubingyangii]OKL49430.1 septation inhibitor protein [Boudabousia liubingyangii]